MLICHHRLLYPHREGTISNLRIYLSFVTLFQMPYNYCLTTLSSPIHLKTEIPWNFPCVSSSSSLRLPCYMFSSSMSPLPAVQLSKQLPKECLVYSRKSGTSLLKPSYVQPESIPYFFSLPQAFKENKNYISCRKEKHPP